MLSSVISLIFQSAANDTFRHANANLTGLEERAAAAFQQRTLPLRTEPFSNSFDFYALLSSIGSIGGVLLTCDYVLRAYKTVSLLAKHWAGSEGGLPPLEARALSAGLGENAATTTVKGGSQSKKSLGVRATQCLTHPYTGIALVMAAMAAVLIVVIGAYIPFVEQYSDVCVKGIGNQTMLSANSFAMAFNYATSKGHATLQNGLQNYDTSRASICTSFATDAVAAEQQVTLQVDRDAFQASVNDLLLLQRCIDPLSYTLVPGSLPVDDSVDMDFSVNPTVLLNPLTCTDPLQAASLKEVGGFLDPLSAKLVLTPSFVGSSSGGAQFNCETNIPSCEHTCTAPDAALLNGVVKQASCMVEWLFHSWMFRFVLAVAVYFLLNFSRTSLTKAITRMHYQSLNPITGFTFFGTVSERGKISKETALSIGPQLQLARQQAMRKSGLYLVQATIPLGLILLALSFVQTNLMYDQTKWQQ